MGHEAWESPPPSGRREVATLGGGCFWCLEPVFRDLEGVFDVVVGYAGGQVDEPSYQQVCSGTTGHAEVVQVTYDPDVLSFRTLLRVFFSVHDPTTPNRQGADVGTQYRSIILFHGEVQHRIAEEVIREVEAAGTWDGPVVTELTPLEAFFRAEDYHQRYYEKNPTQGYCRVVIDPKVAKFREKFRHLRKTGRPGS